MKIRSLDDVSEILEKKPQDNSPKINLSEHSSDAMKLEIYQPWANPVIKFKAPESIIDEMMKETYNTGERINKPVKVEARVL